MRNVFLSFLVMSFMLTLTGCLEQKTTEEGSAVEEKFMREGNSSGTSNSTAVGTVGVKSWPVLGSVCSKGNLTDAESLVCKLDELLDEIAKSGKPLSDFEQDFVQWIQAAVDLENVICKDQAEITFLVVGTANVLASRGLVKLPLALTNASAVVGSIHPIILKLVSAVILQPITQGCSIDKNQLASIYSSNPSAGGGSGSAGGGPGSVSPSPINPVKPNPIGPNPISPNPGTGVGGNPGAPGSLVCANLQAKFKFYCPPHCSSNSSCDQVTCSVVVAECKANSCTCN